MNAAAMFRITAVPLTLRSMEWDPSPETVCRMGAASERTWTTDICSCSICTSYIRVGRIYSVSQATGTSSCLG